MYHRLPIVEVVKGFNAQEAIGVKLHEPPQDIKRAVLGLVTLYAFRGRTHLLLRVGFRRARARSKVEPNGRVEQIDLNRSCLAPREVVCVGSNLW